jgi:hypothetical protein
MNDLYNGDKFTLYFLYNSDILRWQIITLIFHHQPLLRFKKPDQQINTDVRERLQVQNEMEYMHMREIKKQIETMRKIALYYYKPINKRNTGRPRKRWEEQFLDGS